MCDIVSKCTHSPNCILIFGDREGVRFFLLHYLALEGHIKELCFEQVEFKVPERFIASREK